MSDALRRARGLIGSELGVGDWFLVTQARVDDFADITLDQQWIHQEGPAAADGPFGGPIAHGFLTLSLLRRLTSGIPSPVDDPGTVVNYGLDRVRFITPVPVGSRIRARSVLLDARPRGDGILLTSGVTVEIEGGDAPAAVVQALQLIFP